MTGDWSHLDKQMRPYAPILRDELGVDAAASNAIATALAADIQALPSSVFDALRDVDPVGAKARLDEIKTFQTFMSAAGSVPPHPSVVRAQVIVQNYVCFVYLSESCFKLLRKKSAAGSVLRRCTEFLTENPVRAFRNAVAHANWCYKDDFSGLRYWARKGAEPDEPLTEFEVSQLDLGFWQALARCVGYVAFTLVDESAP